MSKENLGCSPFDWDTALDEWPKYYRHLTSKEPCIQLLKYFAYKIKTVMWGLTIMSRAVDTFVQILWKQFTHSFSFKSPVSLPFDFVSLLFREGYLFQLSYFLCSLPWYNFFSVKVSIRLERLPIEGKYVCSKTV